MKNRNWLRTVLIWLGVMATVTAVFGLYAAHVIDRTKHEYWLKMHRPAVYIPLADKQKGSFVLGTTYEEGKIYTDPILACRTVQDAEKVSEAAMVGGKKWIEDTTRLLSRGECITNQRENDSSGWLLAAITHTKDAHGEVDLFKVFFQTMPGLPLFVFAGSQDPNALPI